METRASTSLSNHAQQRHSQLDWESHDTEFAKCYESCFNRSSIKPEMTCR